MNRQNRSSETHANQRRNWFSRHKVLFFMQLVILVVLSLILYAIYSPNKDGLVVKTVTKTIEKVVPGATINSSGKYEVALTIFCCYRVDCNCDFNRSGLYEV